MVERRDCWELPLQGRIVTRLVVDYALGLDFMAQEGHSTINIKIEIDFVLSLTERTKLSVSPGDMASVGPALELFQKEARLGQAFKDGRLTIVFTDGTSVEVPSGSDYEAWQYYGEDGEIVVSLPGGDLAIWGKSREIDT